MSYVKRNLSVVGKGYKFQYYPRPCPHPPSKPHWVREVESRDPLTLRRERGVCYI
jgi:hypothetical protein